LSNLGLGHRGAVLVLYCFAALFGVVALFVPDWLPTTAYALAVFLVVGSLVAIFVLEGLPYERQVKLPKTFSA
jgi:Flp pilus assembly protein TadB